MIRVQSEDFVLQREYDALRIKNVTGAIVTFVGTVRDFNDSNTDNFKLQHYPGMTEKVLAEIEQAANTRWELLASTIVHRIGDLRVDDQIVFVGASSAHRQDAFAACQFMMDLLKTQAPFWKKEGTKWVEANCKDDEAAERWLNLDDD
jgi:molybdopterin synthase catalytic subunit